MVCLSQAETVNGEEGRVTAAEFECLDELEAEALIAWRFHWFSEAGIEPGQALRLAVTPELGPAVEMVQRGLAATMASVVLL